APAAWGGRHPPPSYARSLRSRASPASPARGEVGADCDLAREVRVSDSNATNAKPTQTFSFTGPRMSKFLEVYGIVLVVIVMMLALAAIRPEVFLTPHNLTNILKQNASLALLALGMYVVIVTAGIDLSVGSTMALSMVALAIARRAGLPWPIVIMIGPLIGIAVGLVNGLGLTLL